MQAKYWILTIPYAHFLPYLPPNCEYIRGQLERGEQSSTNVALLASSSSDGLSNGTTVSEGYLHWQVVVAFKSKQRLKCVRDTFGPYHAEPTKSDAACAYVWKDATSIAGTRFELGKKLLKRNCPADWESIRDAAKRGELDCVQADIYVRNYGNLRRINQDNLTPLGMEREIRVYWGATGVGKSRRAWNEAGLEAYPKDPRSKFWDGYRGQQSVVIDEFRGDIDIGHILRWFDRYPVIVEVKGSSVVLKATKIYITSNLDPFKWYPDLDPATKDALMRRLTIFEMTAENTNLLELLMNVPE
jgi:RNA helicase